MTSTLTKWYEEHGRHEIFAGGKKVKMQDETHALYLRDEIVTNEVQHDLDKLGIAKTAREEKARARDKKAENVRVDNRVKNDAAYDARIRAQAAMPDGPAGFAGQTSDLPARSTVVAQAIHHATEHRAQIAGALATNGIDAIALDALDLWAYGDAEGLGA